MPGFVLDTHAAVWYLTEPGKLGNAAMRVIDDATRTGAPLYVSTISLVEIVYLGEKGRIAASATEKLIEAMLDSSVFKTVSVDVSIVRALSRIPRAAVPDMPDRIIGATGLALNAPVVTMDSKIAGSFIPTLW